MKKILFTMLFLLMTTPAMADIAKWEVQGTMDGDTYEHYKHYYSTTKVDMGDGVVCYLFAVSDYYYNRYNAGGISCLKSAVTTEPVPTTQNGANVNIEGGFGNR